MSSDLPHAGQDRHRQSIPLQDLLSSTDSDSHSQHGQPDRPPPDTPLAPAPFTTGIPSILLSVLSYWRPSYDADGGSHGPETSAESSVPETERPNPFQKPLMTSGFRDRYDDVSPGCTEEAPPGDYLDSDTVPLTSRAQPIFGSLAVSPGSPHRHPPQTAFNTDNAPAEGPNTRSIGQCLESGFEPAHRRNYGASLNPHEHRVHRSASTSGALLRAGSIVRAISQRVVNISGESEAAEQRAARRHSRSSRESRDDSSRNRPASPTGDKNFPQESLPEKSRPPDQSNEPFNGHVEPQNPLRGHTLGIFSSENRLRLWLCDLLVHPLTEPVILLLIVLQTILLAVESGANVFTPGNERPDTWGTRPIDWVILSLFIVFTLELFARIVVSGFLLNAAEYSTIDRTKGIKSAIYDQYKRVFHPLRTRSTIPEDSADPHPSAFTRPFTKFMQGQQALPKTLEEQQRYFLARRAFLRHSFNRLDFVAVVSYWIAFILGMTGLESRNHLYIFKMLSCLRILRLLALTHGTAIILRSLKKAAPLLIRVAFLVGFFWLLFAIIGIQSFKSSLSRQCVWLDPLDPQNLTASYTNEMEFCGGHLDNSTGTVMPWVKFSDPESLENLVNGSGSGKGFICPRGSICLEQQNPFNGTVSFDNIFNSLELVFVIMSANTFSDLMYYTMGSDYLQAALFFGAGIMIMLLWLTNLLIAVITSSFQVIREESKSSAFTAGSEAHSTTSPNNYVTKSSSLQRLYSKTRLFWIFVITFALVAQSLRSSSMSSSRESFINATEITATVLLDVEIAIRFFANWRGFHRSARNIFDLGLAVITTIILIPPIRYTRAYAWLSVFQILRVYRVVLAIPVTRNLIRLVLGNAAGIANLMFFVFLMTFLVAIFAAQLFRGEIPIYESGQLNRISFFTIYNSFLGMYQILTSENWTDILYTMTSYTVQYKTAWIGTIFLIGWFIMSFFILVNMFIAVIQENFDVSEDEKRLEQVKAFLQKKELGHSTSNLALSAIFGFGRPRRRKDPLDYGPAMMEMLLKDAVVREFLDDNATDPIHDHEAGWGLQQRSATGLFGGDNKPGFWSKSWGRIVSRRNKSDPNPFYANIRFDGPNDTLDPRQMARQAVSATSARRKAQRDYLARHPRYNDSLYIFRPNNPIRRLCQKLVGPARGPERYDGVEPNRVAWYLFSAFVYAAVVAMVVLACITTPLYQKQYHQQHPDAGWSWYVWTDLAFALLFTVEAVIKVIADGLVWTPNAFLRSSWGIIDSIVLITLWMNVITLFINNGTISRAVGAFKALRALRLLNVSDSARNTFHSLIIAGWWKLIGAAFISLSLLIPFAIYGLNLFSGLLVACNDSDDISTLRDCFGEYSSTPYSDDWPMLAPRVASNPYLHLDNFGSSLFTLFQIVSQEGWTDVSFAAQAIVGRGMQPRDLAAQGNALFFVVFNLLATVFVLTLFISVFMRNYTEQTGVAFLTAEQRSWLELRKLLRQTSPSKTSCEYSERPWRKWCRQRATEKRGLWYRVTTIVLVLHLLLLVAEFDSEPYWWTMTREYIFLSFILFYLSNIAIRIAGLGWARFRRSSWDLYSLAIVCGAFVAIMALLIADTKTDTYVQLHKVFLVGIVLLLIPRNDALDQLFKTAAASLPAIGSLLATWFVFFLVFAIAMTQAFSLTRFGEQGTSDMNFRNVPKALILLFRMSLGEGWNRIMEDYADIEPPLCVEQARFFDSDCGSKSWARCLFVVWNILSMYIFVNLFVSLVYESFSYVYQRSSGMGAVDRGEIRRFKEAWRSVDPEGTGFISKEVFPRLLGRLSGVFRMRIYEPEDSIHQILKDVRHEAGPAPSAANMAGNDEVNLDKLNKRLSHLNVQKIRERRQQFKIFFEEVMVSADPDKGIAFSDLLMILAHYNIISDSKSLKLEEFLRRRARLQRVDEEIRRKVVQGFFDTMYWSRRFLQHKERKRRAQMQGISQLSIPDILVGNEDEEVKTAMSDEDTQTTQLTRWTYLSVGEGSGLRDGKAEAHLGDRTYQHPLSRAPSHTSAASRESTNPSFSLELLHELDSHNPGTDLSGRRGSTMSQRQAHEMLDDSVWMESIRRSATTHRQRRGSHRYGDLS